ncbi:MAG: Unknown protein [uncultured Aureispira sp.]|uniref:Secretion system C-terminal sorting domain-containing protein n=1 Tax=uncultured Aureispira sp. TaxID=1331704 RepID=A0A6S6RZG8_9BACT|nr:MAG: Unknown protein [uncultured Aureispira sp.]
MKSLFLLVLINLFFVILPNTSNAQIEKPNLDFEVEFNDLEEQLEVFWATRLENSVVKLLDNNLNPIKTQILCKDMQGVIDVSDLPSDLYYVQVEHYTGVGIQPIVKVATKAHSSVSDKPLKEDFEFSIFPNPTQDQVTIKSKDFTAKSTVTILDLKGRQVQSSTLNSAKSIVDISNLAQGVYFVRIEDAYRVGVQQLVKK